MNELLAKAEIEPRESWGFKQLQQRVNDIYTEHDEICGYGPDTMLAKLLGNSVTLAHVIRKTPDDFNTINRSITNVFIWAATVANAAGIDLQKVMEKQFGAGCPHCRQMPCLLTQGKTCEKPTTVDLQSKPYVLSPSSLNKWQEHLKKMYANNFQTDNIQTALSFSSTRLAEEIGELIGSAYADIEKELNSVSFQTDINPFESEMADLFAWAFAVANCIEVKNGKYSIGDALKEKYDKGCPYCKSPQCICPKVKTLIESLRDKRPSFL